MTRMWVGVVYIISGFPLSLLIFSGCQQHFGDPFSNQTLHKHRQKAVPALATSRRYGQTKKAHFTSKTYSKLCASESGKLSLSQGKSSLSRSGTGFWNWVSNSAFVHEMSTRKPNLFDNRNALEMRPAFGSAFQSHLSPWLVQLLHTCVRETSTSSQCGWWCTFSSKGDFGWHVTLLQTPAPYLKWKIRLMVTQGTEMDISSSESLWWRFSSSLVVLVYPKLKEGFNASYWTDGNKVIV